MSKRKSKSANGKQRYAVIVKYLDNLTGKESFYKCHVSDLMKLALYLDKRFPINSNPRFTFKTGWKWFNVYENFNNTRAKLGSFTINQRPRSSRI